MNLIKFSRFAFNSSTKTFYSSSFQINPFKSTLLNSSFRVLCTTTSKKEKKKVSFNLGHNPQPSYIIALELPIPPPDKLTDEALQKYFNKCQEKIGFVPNVLRAFSHNETRLRNFVNTYNELMLGESCTLNKLERELIAVAVSSVNRCYYCLVAHGAAVRTLGEDPKLGELVAFNYRVAKV